MVKNASTTAAKTGALLHAVDEFQGRQLVDRLRDLGLDKYVELPQIAVMGDTSSGKSSLLSALSGVAFPSSHELTTRCPTQLVLSREVTFSGSVRLHRFEQNVSETPSPIASMEEVPLAIERLTPQLVNEGQYISDDSIIIELRGPSLPNLTLIDLPGIVRAVGDGEDKSIIPRVRELVNRYMKQTRTIIMAVVPANVDMHNIEILENAQEADPEGTRTIAVVSKLDLVDAGAERGVDELLRNRKKRLALGYHAVKCRGQRDLDDGMTVSSGLKKEKAFFRDHSYWSKLPSSDWGIDKLTTKLVQIMQSNIQRTLPQVVKDINAQMLETREELQALGAPLDSSVARRELFVQLTERFLVPMQAVLKGDYDALSTSTMVDSDGVDMRLRARIRLCDEAFKAKIMATQKEMPGSNDLSPIGVGDFVVVTIDGVEKSFRVDKVQDDGKVLCAAYSTVEWFNASTYKPHPLNFLRRFIVQNRGDELPIFPPYTVFCSIFRQWVDTWEEPMLELVRKYRELTLAVATRVVCELHAPPRVQQYLQERAAATIDELRDTAEVELQKELARERRPYTQNADLFKLYTQLLRPSLESLLKQHLSVADDGRVDFAHLLSVLTEFSEANDEQDTVVMDCGLRAYFETAMTRFVDVVPIRLNDMVLQGFVARMGADLRVTPDDKLNRLLGESQMTQSRRSDLEIKLKTLRDSKNEIEELM